MIGKAFAILPLFVLAPAAPAQDAAPGAYYVRNDTSRAFSCGFRREPARRIHRFLLRRGTDYAHEAIGGDRRTLLCDTAATTQRYRLKAGTRYALVDEQGEVMLRRLDTTP